MKTNWLPRSWSLYLAVFSVNILMLVTSTTLTWSSPSLPKLTNMTTSPFAHPVSPQQASWVSSLIMMGATAGPFLFGFLIDRVGRKPTLLYLGIPFLFCYLAMAFGNTVEMFYVARFICGLAVGGAFTIVPIYICEIAEKDNRGSLTSSTACFGCLGLLFSCSIGPFVSVMTFNLILALPPILYLVLFFFFAPESPHYLIKAKGEEETRKALIKLGRNKEGVQLELTELIAAQKEDDNSGSLLDIFRLKGPKKAFLISIGLMIFQQFSGINAIIFYSQRIFMEAGTSIAPEYCTIVVVMMQLLSSLLTPFIADRLGRRSILCASGIGMMFSEAPLGTYCLLKSLGYNVDDFSTVPLLSLAGFIITFNMGYGPLPWMLLCELFPSNIRSSAVALISTVVWFLSFVVTKNFEEAVVVFGLGQLFLFMAFCSGLAAVFSLLFVVETKGRSLQEIQDLLNQ